MKNGLIWLVLLAFTLITFSCKVIRKTETIYDTVTDYQKVLIKEEVVDTSYFIAPDSTILNMYIECNENNKAILKKIDYKKNGDPIIKWKIKDDYIEIQCIRPAKEWLFHFKNKLIAISKDRLEKLQINKERTIEKKVTFIHRVLHFGGYLFYICLFVVALFVALRKFKPKIFG